MRAGGRVDQLSGNAHPLAGPANRAFEHVANAELAPDLLHVDALCFVCKTRIAGEDEEPADARKRGNDFLDHAVRRDKNRANPPFSGRHRRQFCIPQGILFVSQSCLRGSRKPSRRAGCRECASQGYAETGVLVDADGVQQAVLPGKNDPVVLLPAAAGSARCWRQARSKSTAASPGAPGGNDPGPWQAGTPFFRTRAVAPQTQLSPATDPPYQDLAGIRHHALLGAVTAITGVAAHRHR
jgi:hypothetical protein